MLTFSMLLGCSKKEEKVDIGFIGTLSGRYSDLGQAVLEGVLLALESTDKQGQVNLVVKDDYGKPDEGVKVVNLFETSNVKYVIGPCISSVAAAVVPMLDANNIYMVSPTVSTSSLAGKNDHFYRTMPHNSFKQAEDISSYLINRLSIKDVVILYDSRNSSYSNDIVKKFTEAFLAVGGFVKDVRSFNPDSGESLSNLITEDSKDQPALYYIIGSAMDTSLIIWQIRKLGYKSKVLIRKWAASDDFFRLGGDAVDGAMLFDYYIDQTTPAYADFSYRYKKKFQKDPSWMSIYGYEAAIMLLSALEGVQKGEKFTDALSVAAENNKILVNMKFDEFGDAYLPLHYFVIDKGRSVYKGIAE